MLLKFSKMHGLGNDFMVVDLVTQRADLTPELIRRWADRRTGVGFDQLLVVEPPRDPDADFRYRIFNADGSEAEQCGNGARCFARFVVDHGLTTKQRLDLETVDGRIATCQRDGNVEVVLGIPSTDPAKIPFVAGDVPLAAGDVPLAAGDFPLAAGEETALTYRLDVDGTSVELTPLSIGNPHAVIFVDDVATAPVESLGPAIEKHPRFPNRVNVGFCQVLDPGFARLRVWERGVGETRACGSGACAALVAGRLRGKLGERAKISLQGGKVRVAWAGPGTPVTLTGPASHVYDGELCL